MLIGAHVYRSYGKIDNLMDIILGSIFIVLTIGLITFVVFQTIKIIRKLLKQNRTQDEDTSELELTIRRLRSDRRLAGVHFSRNPLINSNRALDSSSVEDIQELSVSEQFSNFPELKNKIAFSPKRIISPVPFKVSKSRDLLEK